MIDPEMPRDPVEELAEEFLERYRRGERPSLPEYTKRRPDLASTILRLFPTLVMMEEMCPPSADTAEAPPGAVSADGRALEHLGDYRIVRELGRGGMGVVYEAEQVLLGRQVALKVLPYQAAKDETRLKRFWREARAVARLHHTNIVPVFEVGECQGIHFYAMQLIRGQALDGLLCELRRAGRGALEPERASITVQTGTVRGPVRSPGSPRDISSGTPLPAHMHHYREVARLGLQVAEALAYAHEHKILHRDIKPANLLVEQDGTVWVTDFGLAKDEGDTLTRTGDVVGTLRYLAPERFNGISDGRSDVYSLGLTLYEYVTLRPAFNESDRGQLMQRIAREEPVRPRQLDRHVPRDLETIILKASAKEPDRRYASAARMAEDLRRFLSDRPIRARRASVLEQVWRWGRRNRSVAGLTGGIAALLVLVAVVTSVAALRLDRAQNATLAQLDRTREAERDGHGQLYRALIAQALASRSSGQPGQQFDALKALHEAGVLAPDLHLSAGARLERRNALIDALVVPDLGALKQLKGEVPFKGGVGFDTGLEHYALSDELGNISVRRVADDQEQSRLPGPGYAAQRMLFSADGRYLVAKYFQGYADQPQEYRVWEWRRRHQVVYQESDALAVAQDFSPDSHQVVLGGRRDGILTFYELPSGKMIRQQALGYVPEQVAFDPRGKQLAVSGVGLEIRDLGAGWRSVARFAGSDSFGALCWRDDGRFLAAGDGHYHIQVWDVETGRRQALLSGHRWLISEVVFNHGGELLASCSWDGTARLWDPMTGRKLLTAPLASHLQFSPDDTHLAHVHTRPALWQVARNLVCRRLYWQEAGGFGVACVDFSPDGRLLACGSGSGLRLWDPLTGRLLAHLSIGHVASVIFAADGRFMLTSGAAGLLRWPVHRLGQGGGDCRRFGPPQYVRTGATEKIGWDRRGQRVALVEHSSRALLLDLDRPGVNAHVCEHTGLASCAMSANGKWLATGNFKGQDVRIWDPANGQLVRTLRVPGGATALFSSDSRTLLSAADNEFRFWTVGGWTPEPALPSKNVYGFGGEAAFTSSGSIVAVAMGRNAKLFDVQTRQELATLRLPGSQHLSDMCWSPDSNRLAVATTSQAIQLWDLRGLRRRLAAEDLDWDPPLPPKPQEMPAVQVQVDLGDANSRLRLGEIADPDYAVRFNSIVLAFSPFNEMAYLHRAAALAGQGKMALARADAILALHLLPPGNGPWFEPQHAVLFNDLAWWSIGGRPPRRDAPAAVLLAERAVAIAPDDGMYWNTMGVACYRQGHYPEAVTALKRSLRQSKGRTDAFDLFFLAMCHHHLGQPARARACYDEAVRWVLAHRTRLTSAWAKELLLFRTEAAALLHILNDLPGPRALGP